MRIQLLFIFVVAIFFEGCSSSRKIVTSKKQKRIAAESKLDKLPSVKQSQHVKKLQRDHKSLNKYTLQYIRKYAPLAVLEMHQYAIPASITLAQGILESGNGRSGLASKSNNHFGIKCHSGWKGARVYHDDDEKGECFRKYKNSEKSYRDHSIFLESRDRYNFLFKYNKKNYFKWAKGLKKAGYATDPKYAEKLISIIERYELWKLDGSKKPLNKSRERKLSKNQEKEIKQKQLLINKFKAKASKASMAQSLMKQLDKVELIEVDQDDNATMNVRFAISKEPGKIVVEAENMSKSYGDNHVLENVNLLIERNSRIAFVGQNGQGKSTLAKIIVGEIEHQGKLKLGHNVQIGYFAQNQAEYLDGNKTVHDTMLDAANEKTRTKVRDILGAFLFRGTSCLCNT